MTGVKHDMDKTRYDLIAPEFLAQVADVLTFGAKKYPARNWEKGIFYSRVFAAAMRHLWAWWRGEKMDPESGLHHLAHASCCLMFLLTYESRGMSAFDDSGATGYRDLHTKE